MYGNSIQYNKNNTPDITIDGEVRYALMFNNNESEFYRQLFTPPSATTILNNWVRTDAQNYYTEPTTIPTTSDASKWFIDVDGSFVQPNNTANLNTIISPDLLDRYEFETILTSPNSDDDYIGIVVSSGYISGEYIALLAGIHTKGIGSPKFSIQLYRNGVNLFSGGGVLVGENGLTDLPGWSNTTMKIKVIKDRNNITVVRGDDWNSNSFSTSAILNFDIFSLSSDLHFLAEKQRYGFATMSQAGSRYLNYSIKQTVNFDSSVVYNRSGQKYIYNTTTNNWDFIGNNASLDLSYPRNVINPLTKQIFKFENDGSSVILRDSAIKHIDEDVDYTITIQNNTNVIIEKSTIESNYISDFGSVEYMQTVYIGPNISITENTVDISITTTNTSSEIYVYLRAGEVISFKRIIINVI
jgi:hypothetical protein